MTSRFPVLFVSLDWGWGGGARWQLTLARALLEREWPVEVLAWPGSELARRAQAAGIPVWTEALRWASLLNPAAIQRLGQGLAERRPEAVILGGYLELASAGLLARWAGIAQVIFRQGAEHGNAPGLVQSRLVGWAATRLLADSGATLAALVKRIPDPAMLRPRVAAPCVDAASWLPPEERAPTGRIAAAAPLEWEQGLHLALQALRVLRQRMGHATLRLAGEGSQRANLGALADALGLAGAVEFSGGASGLSAALGECDAFVLPARGPGGEFALIEAMLAGLPTVAFDLPVAREIVRDGETGLLVPDGDAEALAEALAALLAAPERARAMGRAGRALALERFSAERAAAALEPVLRGEDGP